MYMATTSKRSSNINAVDEDSEAILYQGASMAQICHLFGMDARDVKPKISGQVVPCGKRRGHDVYQIKDVAPYLVSPPYDLDEFIQRMTIADLPPVLRKEFWAGLRSRQLYEKEDAELWPTSDVVDMISELFKTLRMSLLLFRENVERETELSDRQRDIIVRLVDNAMEDLYAKTVSKFAKGQQTRSSPEVLSEVEPEEEDL